MSETKRLDEIDILKSIGIILMIMGHIGFGNEFDFYIHAFHMPMFYVISGFLYKKSALNFIQFTRRKVKSLLIPYILFALFHLVIISMVHMKVEVKYILSIFTFNTDNLPIAGALWFLTSLFFVDILFYCLDRIDNVIIKYCLIIVSSVSGCVIPNYYRLPFALDTSMMGVGLFVIGQLGKKTLTDKQINNGLFGIVSFIIGSALCFTNGYINVRMGYYSNIVLYFIVAITITYGLYVISIAIKNTDNFLMDELKFIGRNSIIYVCLNQLILLIPNKISAVYINSTPILVAYKILVLLIALVFLHLITIIVNTKYFKWVLGK